MTPAPAPRAKLGLAPKEISFEASGMSFRALEWGPASGRLALCLHGYPDTAWTWRHLGPYLAARGWRVVAPFQRGYAPTDLAPDGCYQVGALAADATGAHRALGGDEQAVLIGHDWGAIASYAAASHSPWLFRRIVTLAVPPLPAVSGAPGSVREWADEAVVIARQLRMSWYMLFQQLPWVPELVLPRLAPRLWSRWSLRYDAADDVARLRAALPDRTRANAALSYYRAMVRPWTHLNRYAAEQSHWRAVPDCPILYLHGTADGCMQSALAERARSALTAPSQVELVAGTGHFLHLERPDEVNALIARFIDN